MALIMAGFLVMIPLSNNLGCGGATSATVQPQGSAAQEADWRTAARAYERAVKLLRKQKGAAAKRLRLDTLQQLVSVYLFLQDPQLATSVYGQITALKPKYAQSFFDMATVAISAGDTSTALLAFSTFLRLDPTSPDAASVKDWIAANSGKTTPTPSSSTGGGQCCLLYTSPS